MNSFKSLILISMSLSFLSACATDPKKLDSPAQNLSCAELLTEIDGVEVELIEAENLADDNHGGINNVHTGGIVGVQGGSSSGVDIGVGVSFGAPFGSNRYKRVKLEAEELKTRLIALQKQALEKKC